MADQGTEGLFSSYLRARRIQAALPHLRGRLLDYSCGSGALADYIDPALYFGFDRDPAVIGLAKRKNAAHTFDSKGLPEDRSFDTIAVLAVIEHVQDPAGFLMGALRLLARGGSIVLTAPHPAFHRLHNFGARLGLFSRSASEEHQQLLDGRAMRSLASSCGLNLTEYRRFLLGANQLFVLNPRAETED